MKSLRPSSRTALAALLLASLPCPAVHAADDTNAEIQALREQIRLLDQKVTELQRKQDAAAATAAKPTAGGASPATALLVTPNDQGLKVTSADGTSFLHVGGLVQADTRWFFSQSKSITNNDAFLIRRARLILDGQFNGNTSFLFVPDLSGSVATLFDAYVNVAFTPQVQLRAGRFKSPVGLEQLQADPTTFFTERSFVSQITPNRDIGLMLWGNVLDGRLSYAAGVFDGVSDGQSNGTVIATGAGATTPVVNTDADNNKDVEARLFAQPFKNNSASPLKGLGFGVGAGVGRELPAAGLAGYKSDALQSVFAYRTTTIINGPASRVSPQAYYYYGPFGLLGEYVLSTIKARPSASGKSLAVHNQAWQLAAGYVLTGEDSSYTGVTPRKNFNWNDGTWGAFEVVARCEVLDLDRAVFAPNPSVALSLADPAANPGWINGFGLGLNWSLSKSVRASLDYFHENFSNNVAVPSKAVLQHDENAVVTRLSIAF